MNSSPKYYAYKKHCFNRHRSKEAKNNSWLKPRTKSCCKA